MTYGEAADSASQAKTRLWVVSLDADPPVVKFETVVKAPQKPKTMKQQKAVIKERRKKDLEQRRGNTFKEVRSSTMGRMHSMTLWCSKLRYETQSTTKTLDAAYHTHDPWTS